MNFRKAIYSKLHDDVAVATLMGGTAKIRLGWPAEEIEPPLTIYTVPTDQIGIDVPLRDIVFQLTTFAVSNATANALADRYRALLHRQPLVIDGGRAQLVVEISRGEIFEAEPNLWNVFQQFRLLAYEVAV